jgi:alcohol dehydrogenase (cytochrome c)
MKKTYAALIAVVVVAAAGSVVVYANWFAAEQIVGLAIDYVEVWNAPAGTLQVEQAQGGAPVTLTNSAPDTLGGAWPGYNRTLTSARFSPLAAINTTNIGQLKILCSYDTGDHTAFEAGLIMVNGALIGTTANDIFALDPNTCAQRWRTHESYTQASVFAVNRGAASLDGRLFRGTEDGRVLAYDAATGTRLWQTSVADPSRGETTPAAPIAWNGMVFIGNAGGDVKGVRGRMYALDAKTGKIIWEFFLVAKAPGDITRGPQGAGPVIAASWGNGPTVPISGGASWTSYTLDPATGLLYVPGGNPAPDFANGVRPGENLYAGAVVVLDAKTGAYAKHFEIVPHDWHDWDISSAPAIVQTRGGHTLLAEAPKDGHLYGFDLTTGTQLYRMPVTRVQNTSETFTPGNPVHFCPGAIGGAEWNGAAYDPDTNLMLTGEVDWCSTVTLQTDAAITATPAGAIWTGNASRNPFHVYGTQDRRDGWAGWVYATDADTGAWKWRAKSNYPVLSGITPTAGGLVFFGDMGGNFYALDASTGARLWGAKIGGAIGGGVIAYNAGSGQRIAVAAGFTAIVWPTEITTGKVFVLGVP